MHKTKTVRTGHIDYACHQLLKDFQKSKNAADNDFIFPVQVGTIFQRFRRMGLNIKSHNFRTTTITNIA